MARRRIPRRFLRHRIVVEPYAGQSANGALYGPPRAGRCLVQDARVLVARSGGEGGDRATEPGTVFLDLYPWREVLTPQARVRIEGRVVEVVEVLVRDGGGISTPDHVELKVR